MIDQKYLLTETLFWALTTFYAYGGLTKGGPFDKIFFLCFLEHLGGHYRLSSQKVVFLVKYHFRAFRSELEIKVG